jgi:lysophospholipase L1-like esterase
MKNIFYKSCLVLASVSWLASCKPEKDLIAPDITAGSLDLTTYVAVGNSLTSGYSDNGLYYEGQKSSYVNVLADQFKLAKPDLVFNTPYVSSSSVGCGAPNLSFSPAPDIATFLATTFTITLKVDAPYSLQTKLDCAGKSGLVPAPKSAFGDGNIIFGSWYKNETGYTKVVSGADIFLNGGLDEITTAPSIYNTSGPFHNVGVPGARAIDVNKKGFGGQRLVSISGLTFNISNPYFSRFAKSQANSSMLSDAMELKPTFFTLFIGNNDVLLWATAGGVEVPQFGPSITPSSQFNDSIDVIVNTLTSGGAQGVIVNIADISGAAFFTFNKPNTNYWIQDDVDGVRQMKTDDLLLLTVPLDSINCYGMGSASTSPIPDQYVLTSTETQKVKDAVVGYNAKLKAKADEKGLAFFDMDAFTKANQSGFKYNGMDMSGEFVTGGIFSLDGLHLTPRGYSALANEMLKTINAKFGSNFPGVDLTKKNAVVFPE